MPHYTSSHFRMVPLLFMSVLLLPLSAYRQDPLQEWKKDGQKKQPLPRIQFDHIKNLKEGDGVKAVLLVKAEIQTQTTFLKADTVIVWGESQDPDEVYAEDNVVYIEGETQIRCDRMFVNLKQSRGIMINSTHKSMDKTRKMPVIFRAEELRQVAKGHWIAEKGMMSYCTYGVPHFDFVSSKVGMTETDGGNAHLITAQNFMSRLWSVPFFYWPFFVFYTDDDIPLRNVKVGESKRWGWFQEYDLGFKIRKGLIDGLISPFVENDPNDDRKKWGDVGIDLDYRRKRGHGYGLNLDYGWDGYSGIIQSYYMSDKGPNPHNDFDRRFLPLENRDRWRTKSFHRQEITDDIRFEIESSYLSDRNLLEEFYELEFKEGKEQETVLYGRWVDENRAATYRERHRLNDFQNQLEYLPQMGFSWYSQPIFPSAVNNLYLTLSSQLTHMRWMSDTNHRTESIRLWRFDQQAEVEAPYDLDLIQISPFVAGRLTVYEENIAKDQEEREIAAYGVRLNTRAERIYDFCSEFLNMNGIRHILSFETRYTNQFYTSTQPQELFGFDSVDTQDEFEEIALQLNSGLETKTRRYQAGARDDSIEETRQFFGFSAQIEFYPEARRDTTGFRVNNYLFPFNPLTLVPGGSGSESRDYSNLFWIANVSPKDYLSFAVSGEYNLLDRQEEERVVQATLNVIPGMTLSGSRYYFKNVTDTYGMTAIWNLTEKWSAAVTQIYDSKANLLTNRNVVVSRDYHDFLIQGIYEQDKQRDDRAFWISILPKFLGQPLKTGELWQRDRDNKEEHIFKRN